MYVCIVTETAINNDETPVPCTSSRIHNTHAEGRTTPISPNLETPPTQASTAVFLYQTRHRRILFAFGQRPNFPLAFATTAHPATEGVATKWPYNGGEMIAILLSDEHV